jgi:hypothetical protein
MEGGGSIEAEVMAPEFAEAATLPVKLVLLGTNFSTLSDTAVLRPGLYRSTLTLRHLPPGTYQPVVSRPGSKTLRPAPFRVEPGQVYRLRWDLSPDAVPGNLLRNPDFSMRWVDRNAPDFWRYDKARTSWVSDNIKAEAGMTYRVTADSGKPPARAVSIQWMAEHWLATGNSVPLEGGHATAMAPPGTHFVRLVISGKDDPAAGIDRLSLERIDRRQPTARQVSWRKTSSGRRG